MGSLRDSWLVLAKGSVGKCLGILGAALGIVTLLILLRGEMPGSLVAEASARLGRVRGGGIIDYTFSIPNDTQQVWDLSRVVATCACARAEAVEHAIPPGRSLEVRVAVSTAGLKGDLRVRATCLFENRPPLDLLLELHVLSGSRVVPSRVDFGSVVAGQDATASIHVDLDDGVQLTGLRSSHPDVLRVQQRPSSPTVELVVQAKDVGPLPRNLQVELSTSSSETLAIPVIGIAEHPVRVVPRTLILGPSAACRRAFVRVEAVGRCDAEVEIRDLQADEGLRVRELPRTHSSDPVVLEVSLEGRTDDGRCEVRARLDNNETVLLIPVLIGEHGP